MEITRERLDEILLEHAYDSASLIAVFQAVQEEAGYLPYPALLHISEQMRVPMARLHSLGTFYKTFSLEPTGRHTVCLCMGIACHIRGGQQVMEKLQRDLQVAVGGTTADRKFTLETVRCLGCCSLAPVMRLDDQIHGRINQSRAVEILQDY